MKFASIDDRFFQLFSPFDPELLHDKSRPYLIILKLRYDKGRHDFALPFRSNISETTPKSQFYPLPPRKTTGKHRRHGLHFIKMFPIKNEYLEKYHTENDPYYIKIHQIINRNKKEIIQRAQEYLDNYQSGTRENYCTNIHDLFLAINGQQEVKEVATTSSKALEMNAANSQQQGEE